YSNGCLELTAPLQPNINDKGTAFAGSISSLLVLAGWGVVTLRLQEAGIRADVAVSRSETDYKRPIRSDMRSIADVSNGQIDQLILDLTENQRGRIKIQSRLFSQGKRCADMSAHYVVFPIKSS
ncbi:MAG: YiiD C-terminal domain-containing protein, partial [Verrucomicrobia bacterium]|nr:YiiD C-terminal domain-containing protein [Verrucomicrobiota bacterium]